MHCFIEVQKLKHLHNVKQLYFLDKISNVVNRWLKKISLSMSKSCSKSYLFATYWCPYFIFRSIACFTMAPWLIVFVRQILTNLKSMRKNIKNVKEIKQKCNRNMRKLTRRKNIPGQFRKSRKKLFNLEIASDQALKKRLAYLF